MCNSLISSNNVSYPNQEVCFVFNLLQDLNISRGLIWLVYKETKAQIRFLISKSFIKRDNLGIWQKELGVLAKRTNAEIIQFDDSLDTYSILQGRQGVIIASSESHLNAHRDTRDTFRVAPSSFLRITLQHGLECVGFLQGREHIMAHGRDIYFNADIVCGWLPAERLTSMTQSERDKLVFTGPPTLLPGPPPEPDATTHPLISGGIICENMHSVRLSISGDHRASFMDTFFTYCKGLESQKRNVTLRPHPGGQYVLKNKITLPENVILNNLPMYQVKLSDYQYGISAPSTVLLDMVLAGIPTAVWKDPNGVMDIGNYAGLTTISTLDEWQVFEQEVREDPEPFLVNQKQFLARLGIPTNPAEVRARFLGLILNALDLTPEPKPLPLEREVKLRPVTSDNKPPKRVLFMANSMVATLQLSFLEPLAPLFDNQDIQHQIITEKHITDYQTKNPDTEDWLRQKIRAFNPDLILCCRYSGPFSQLIVQEAHEVLQVPLIYHIDDDLLGIPRELGHGKYKFHNHPTRIDSVNTLLNQSDLVYASTEMLKKRLRLRGITTPISVGAIYAASRVLNNARPGAVQRIGFMGVQDHTPNFEFLTPSLIEILDANPTVHLEIFGPMPIPPSMKRFESRVRTVPPIMASYRDFLQAMADRDWDIGLCRINITPFNQTKADTKWVEYTACGMATIASVGLAYDTCIGADRGLLVKDDQWLDAIQFYIDSPEERYRAAILAQAHLQTNYSRDKLLKQILEIFATAKKLHAQKGAPNIPSGELFKRLRTLALQPNSNGQLVSGSKDLARHNYSPDDKRSLPEFAPMKRE